MNPNRPPVEDDNDWEKYVHGAPRYGPVEEQEEGEAEEEVREEDHPLEGDLFKVPDIFSDVTSSSEGYQGDVGETSRDAEQEPVINVDHVWRSNSSSEDNINVIVPEVPCVIQAHFRLDFMHFNNLRNCYTPFRLQTMLYSCIRKTICRINSYQLNFISPI